MRNKGHQLELSCTDALTVPVGTSDREQMRVSRNTQVR